MNLSVNCMCSAHSNMRVSATLSHTKFIACSIPVVSQHSVMHLFTLDDLSNWTDKNFVGLQTVEYRLIINLLCTCFKINNSPIMEKHFKDNEKYGFNCQWINNLLLCPAYPFKNIVFTITLCHIYYSPIDSPHLYWEFQYKLPKFCEDQQQIYMWHWHKEYAGTNQKTNTAHYTTNRYIKYKMYKS